MGLMRFTIKYLVIANDCARHQCRCIMFATTQQGCESVQATRNMEGQEACHIHQNREKPSEPLASGRASLRCQLACGAAPLCLPKTALPCRQSSRPPTWRTCR